MWNHYAPSSYVDLRYVLPTFCGLDAKPDRIECWKKYQRQESSHSRSADQCIGERSPKCRERERDEAQDRIEAERLMEDQKDGDDSHQAQRRRQDGHGQG